MPTRRLPARPNLSQYKKQAKELVKAYRPSDGPRETARPRTSNIIHASLARRVASQDDDFGLTDAQLVIAANTASTVGRSSSSRSKAPATECRPWYGVRRRRRSLLATSRRSNGSFATTVT
jgi:hypothetical protein